MKYTKEITERLLATYGTAPNIDTVKNLAIEFSVPERSIISKLSSLGVYQRKTYVNKRGEPPTKKAEHIENIAKLLNINLELLDSLEKVNKNVLYLLEKALSKE